MTSKFEKLEEFEFNTESLNNVTGGSYGHSGGSIVDSADGGEFYCAHDSGNTKTQEVENVWDCERIQ